MLIVARFVFEKWLAVAFQWLGVARCDFSEPGVARRFLFFTSFPVADNVHSSRVLCSEVLSYTNYGLYCRFLLLLAFCFYRTTHDLGLGLQLIVLHSELVLLQRQLPRRPELQPRRRSKSYARNCSSGSGSVAWPPSRVKTLVFTSTQDISADDAMSRTKQSWSCSDQHVRAGIAQGLRTVRHSSTPAAPRAEAKAPC